MSSLLSKPPHKKDHPSSFSLQACSSFSWTARGGNSRRLRQFEKYRCCPLKGIHSLCHRDKHKATAAVCPPPMRCSLLDCSMLDVGPILEKPDLEKNHCPLSSPKAGPSPLPQSDPHLSSRSTLPSSSHPPPFPPEKNPLSFPPPRTPLKS